MSRMSLIVKIVIPVIIAVAAIWGYLTYAHPSPAPEAELPPVTQQPAEQTPAAQTPAQQIQASGSSDASLDADLSSIDSQFDAASQSSAAVDAGLGDKAGDTSY